MDLADKNIHGRRSDFVVILIRARPIGEFWVPIEMGETDSIAAGELFGPFPEDHFVG